MLVYGAYQSWYWLSEYPFGGHLMADLDARLMGAVATVWYFDEKYFQPWAASTRLA